MKKKQFVIILEDDLFEDGLDVTCWGYDELDAINDLRLEYKKLNLPLPKVIKTTELEQVDKNKGFYRLLRDCFNNTL